MRDNDLSLMPANAAHSPVTRVEYIAYVPATPVGVPARRIVGESCGSDRSRTGAGIGGGLERKVRIWTRIGGSAIDGYRQQCPSIACAHVESWQENDSNQTPAHTRRGGRGKYTYSRIQHTPRPKTVQREQ